MTKVMDDGLPPSPAAQPTESGQQVIQPMHPTPLAPSLAQITPSRIRAIADVAFGMGGVLKLHFGESNLPTPAYIKAAAAQAIEDGYTFYSENAGLPTLRTAIAQKYHELQQVTLDPATEIIVTASGVQALNVTIRCTLDPGDEALILTPNWPNGSEIVRLYGATPKEVPFGLDGERFVIDFAALAAAVTPQTKLLLYTSPSNPLGWVATRAEQQQLLDFCRQHGLWLLADEVYERIYFNGPVAPSILQLCTARRRRDRRTIFFQKLLHDGLAIGLGRGAPRSDCQSDAPQ